jgi:hypothetical protein
MILGGNTSVSEEENILFFDKIKYFYSMTLIVDTRNVREEKALKNFLQQNSIRYYSEAEEDAALLKAMEKGRKSAMLTAAEKESFLTKLKKAK